jgi:hypothetical protein
MRASREAGDLEHLCSVVTSGRGFEENGVPGAPNEGDHPLVYTFFLTGLPPASG